MNKTIASTVVMVEPASFGFNEETAKSNSFQSKVNVPKNVQDLALKEFKACVKRLESAGVNVSVYKSELTGDTPDSIFPNNWFSTHASGELIIYPMATENRRREVRPDIIENFQREGFTKIDFSNEALAKNAKYLEGTGSMIFDHKSKLVYAALSHRTNKSLFERVANHLGYRPISFTAYNSKQKEIYHTNVMMCIGADYVLVGLETIDERDRKRVEQEILDSGKEMILLSREQVYSHFAGNMLQLATNKDETVLVMSSTARKSLTNHQLQRLRALNDSMIMFDIPTIESVGGGSARCMMAEIFKIH